MTRFEQARYIQDEERYEPLLSEKDSTTVDVDGPLPDDLTRDDLTMPEISEPELARHYTRLSEMTYGVDNGPYPLGSCTMKYNPSFTEDVAADPSGFVHPDRPDETVQGNLELMYTLQRYLAKIGGMEAVTLQPPAGAAGEFTGIMITRAYHEYHGEDQRDEVIVPDTAHGTNFASAAMGGYEVIEIPSSDDGRVHLDALEDALSENTAALMLTNPNTLGLFEKDIVEVADMIHDAGALLYYDGANLNALLGRARPGDMGFDIMHYNVHKTFATPHGGGGPGAGPVGVCSDLAEFLPNPQVCKDGDEYTTCEPEHTIGKVHGFQGNWLVLIKAFAYIARLGDEGLRDTGAKAVLNANYLGEQLDIDIPFRPFHHEFVASGDRDATDFAKRMLDYGVHPPTTKFPHIVKDALMTEPTESENRHSLDRLASAFNDVMGDSDEELAGAPNYASAGRVDQTKAAKDLILSWQDLDAE
ncbi:MAG TPA: aminomethyl-transferring glycine dehydrogenase subunit GcvPB [Natrialbaceae archaeon]|nr:aminomethyl-transferring glycine dehydrogenase subunit GcvPB [Natrialbaceae archaeon]